MLKTKLVGIFAMFVFLAMVPAPVLALSMFNPFSYGGHTYYLTDDYSSWTDAEAFAVSQGGHLWTIDDASESAAVWGNYSINGEDYWIGLWCQSGDYTIPANWGWVSGSTSSYRNWLTGQPDEWNPSYPSRYAVIGWDLTEGWGNYPNSEYRMPRAIIEIGTANGGGDNGGGDNGGGTPVPEPGTILLIGAGLMALGICERKKLTL